MASAGPESVEFGLTLNDATSTQLHVGWPVVVTLNALWVGEGTGAIEFERSALRLRVRNEAGTQETWPWVLAEGAERWTLTRSGAIAEVRWSLSAEQAAALLRGRYRLDALWADRQCEALEIEVIDAPSTPTADQESRRLQLTARVASLRGDAAGAERAANDGLLANPGDIALLQRKALALEAKGDLKGAYAAIQQALELAHAEPTPPGAIDEPPVGLLLIEARIDRELFKRFMATRDGGR